MSGRGAGRSPSVRHLALRKMTYYRARFLIQWGNSGLREILALVTIQNVLGVERTKGSLRIKYSVGCCWRWDGSRRH